MCLSACMQVTTLMNLCIQVTLTPLHLKNLTAPVTKHLCIIVQNLLRLRAYPQVPYCKSIQTVTLTPQTFSQYCKGKCNNLLWTISQCPGRHSVVTWVLAPWWCVQTRCQGSTFAGRFSAARKRSSFNTGSVYQQANSNYTSDYFLYCGVAVKNF